MKVHLLNYEPDRIGGGWSQARYLYRLFDSDYENAEAVLLCGPTQATREQVEKVKQDGKKFILRVDNAVRNSNNRGTGMPRLFDFAQMADLVIYQSEWARNMLYPFLGVSGPVILNGVDTDIYNHKNRIDTENSYLYARSSRDEGKGWLLAWYWFVNKNNRDKTATLEIAGKFSGENLEYNFDFFNNEKYTFVGEQPTLIDSFKRNRYFLYTYAFDACSNTLLEAIASGCEIIDVCGMLKTGGAPEIMDCPDISIKRMLNEYKNEIKRLM